MYWVLLIVSGIAFTVLYRVLDVTFWDALAIYAFGIAVTTLLFIIDPP